MGLPEDLVFRTDGQLAIDILAAHRPGNRTPARPPAPAWQRRALAGLAAPSPGPLTLVPPAGTTFPRTEIALVAW